MNDPHGVILIMTGQLHYVEMLNLFIKISISLWGVEYPQLKPKFEIGLFCQMYLNYFVNLL
jgi:hypothetical protein